MWHMASSSHEAIVSSLSEPAMLTAAIVAAAVDETWAEKGWGMTDLDHVWARGSHLQLVANILWENLWKTSTSPTTLCMWHSVTGTLVFQPKKSIELGRFWREWRMPQFFALKNISSPVVFPAKPWFSDDARPTLCPREYRTCFTWKTAGRSTCSSWISTDPTWSELISLHFSYFSWKQPAVPRKAEDKFALRTALRMIFSQEEIEKAGLCRTRSSDKLRWSEMNWSIFWWSRMKACHLTSHILSASGIKTVSLAFLHFGDQKWLEILNVFDFSLILHPNLTRWLDSIRSPTFSLYHELVHDQVMLIASNCSNKNIFQKLDE